MKSRIMLLGKKFLGHELVTGSFLIFSGTFFGNILAFILNLFFARSLSYADYAIYSSLLSIITLAAIPSTSINTIIVKFATSFFIKNQQEKLKSLYLLFLKYILGLCLLTIFLFIAFSRLFDSYLHIDNVWYIIFCGFVISAFYLNALNTSFLQGLLKFKFMAFINMIGSVLKLAIGILLVVLGYRAFSGLGALFAMVFGMYLIAYVPLEKIFKEKVAIKKISLDTKKIFSFALPTFVTILFLTSFTSVDVILVKHFFTSQQAGFYSGLSLMGKVIFYFTSPIPMVMFPLLIKRHVMGKNFNNLFYLALLLVIIPSVIITIFYFAFPNISIHLFLGGRDYLSVSGYLGLFGLYLTVFSLVNVCVNFFLSLNKTNISFSVAVAAVLQVILIYIFHSNFYQVIGVSILVLFALLLYLLLLYFKNYRNYGNPKETVVPLSTTGI